MRAFFCLLALLFSPIYAQIPVLVSIAPQKFLVEQIGQEHVAVTVIVPPGACSHSYDPTPRQTLTIQEGKIWFRIGESFEHQLIRILNDCEIVDQRDSLELIDDDPHIWLSPQHLKLQAIQITDTLCRAMPEQVYTFRKNLHQLLTDLSEIDAQIREMDLAETILVSHPAYGYFCDSYGIEQLSIEMEGHAPTPRYITDLIRKGREKQIKTVFLQAQHSVKGGRRVAHELGAQTVYLDPYAENVIDNLTTIAKAFSQHDASN